MIHTIISNALLCQFIFSFLLLFSIMSMSALSAADTISSLVKHFKSHKSILPAFALYTNMSQSKGVGLTSEVNIRAHSFVIEYCGDVISFEEAEKREAAYQKSDVHGCYMFYCTSGSHKFW
jgi:hypothetical protein